MKLRYKVLVILALFLGIVILNNSDCFAASTKDNFPFEEKVIEHIETFLTEEYDSYFTVSMPSSNGYQYSYYSYLYNSDSFVVLSSDNRYMVCFDYSSSVKSFKILDFTYNSSNRSFHDFTPSIYERNENLSNKYGFRINHSSFDSKYEFITNGSVYFSNQTVSQLLNGNFNDLSFLDGSIYEPPVTTTLVTLYIDDQNLRKRFKFQLNIPLEKEDTKYYIFLDEYTRYSYNKVKADFCIYTVSTPEDYDYSEYENYLYYDDLEDGTLYFPAGCTIKQYYVQAENGEIYDLVAEYEFVATRSSNFDGGVFDFLSFFSFLCQQALHGVADEATSELFPTSATLSNFSITNIFYMFYDANHFDVNSRSLKEYLQNYRYHDLNDYLYHNILKHFYYGGDFTIYDFDDLCCGNCSVISYENLKRFHSDAKTSPFYEFFRKTKVYNEENKISENCYVLNYSDGEGVSALLPGDVNSDYLTSPFFKDNENSASGGNIIYDISEIVQGNKIIDYSKEENPIHNTYNGDYIENFEEGDNIVINNNYTEVIDKTSDEYLLHNIYTTLLDIKSIISDMNDNLMNTTNNFTYNLEQTLNYWFSINTYELDYTAKEISNTAKTHLGIIYNPFEFLIYTVTLFSRMDNTTEIVLDIPEISYKNTILIPETHFSFTDYMNDLPILKTVHSVYLTAVDFILLGLLVALAIKIWKEVFSDDS